MKSKGIRILFLMIWFVPSSIVVVSALCTVTTGEFGERWFGFVLLAVIALALSAVLAAVIAFGLYLLRKREGV